MLERKRNSAADNLSKAEPAIEKRETWRLLRFVVPLRDDEQEGRADGRFEDTQEDAGDEKCAVGCRCCTTSSGNSPKNDIQTEPLRRWDPLEKVNCIRKDS